MRMKNKSFVDFRRKVYLYLVSEFAKQMSRCEHGELISLFCIHQGCTWREAGGCNHCIKKYHSHAQNFDILGLDKIEELNKLFYVRPEIKPKSQVLQQAVYNYFIIMKSQINASLDAVSRGITSKLSHPYLYSQSFINVFRKIKNKEYKKINRKELRKYSKFVNTQNVDIVELNQKKLYKEEVAQLAVDIKNINQVFHKYSKVIDKLDNSFNVEKSFLNKIIQVSETITGIKAQQETEDKVSTQSYQSSGSSSQKVKLGQQASVSLSVDVKGATNDKNAKDNKVSYKTETVGNHVKEETEAHENFNKNQKEISERKKKLFDMLNKPQGNASRVTDFLQKSLEKNSNISRSAQKNQSSILTKADKQILKESNLANNHKNFSYQNQIVPIIEQNEEPRAQKNNQDTNQLKEKQIRQDIELSAKKQEKQTFEQLQSQEDKLFQNLMRQGINISQIIAHTILPRVESKPKLYQDTREVKERKITIPVKKFDKQEESFSPILKRKRQNKENRPSPLFEGDVVKEKQMEEIVFFNQSNTISDQINENEAEDEAMLLKDQEANSLALLIQSLPLQAEKAIPLLEASLKYAHNNLSAADYLSYLYLETSKPKQCLQLCNQVLEQIEESPQINELSMHIRNNKAAALNLLGRYSQSIGILEHCLTFAKKDISFKNLGDSYFSISIYEKAILNYQKAIEMNNQMDEAYYNLAAAYFIQKHFHEAKLNVSKAIKLNPRNEDYLLLSRQIAAKLQS